MNTKNLIKIFVILGISILLVLFFVFIYKMNENKKNIEIIYDLLAENNTQNTEDKKENILIDYKNNQDIIGIIKIDKIKFEGLVYDGTDLETLDKGVGHFKNSPFFDGNVCLAAHNTTYWKNLYKLENGDKIIYSNIFGTKEYEVTNKKTINEDDWSLLEDTKENKITLITCVKGVPNERLCVQAIEIKK